MKAGQRIKNYDMGLTIIRIEEEPFTNVALMIRETDGMLITGRDLTLDANNGKYSWSWGHYFNDLKSAVDDYIERCNGGTK